MKIKTVTSVKAVFDQYPKHVRPKLLRLRELIVQTAEELEEVQELEETLKWGEPSYLAKKGSTIRIDWKKKTPNQYAIYFKCTSKLVPTFKNLYEGLFSFENTRAIVFQLNDDIPAKELKHCISLALRYHHLKKLPNLGVEVIKK